VKPDPDPTPPSRTPIGQSPPRAEGRAKVVGGACYVDDLHLETRLLGVRPGLLHGVTVRSPEPRGRIRGIRFLPGVPWDEFTIVTAADIPGPNYIALIENDQPCLAAEQVNHAEEPVVLLAHPDRLLVRKAQKLVAIDIDPLPAVFDLDESLAGRERIWRSDNVFKRFTIEKGEAIGSAAAWADAEVIVEGDYETGAQEQLYIEPNGMIAQASSVGGVTVWGSMQCPYYIHKALQSLFDLPAERVRVVQAETGGGFGGKEEYPSMIAAHAALLAWKSGQTVKLIYDRLEDMVATTKRHPSRTRIRSGFTRDGRLVALDIDFRIDGGAYMTLSPVVLSRGALHASGPYSCPNVRVLARAVATNAPPHGAFRGFGAPQSVFAMERHLDRAAARLGISPAELRRRNFLRDGQTTATGQVIRDGVDLVALQERALTLADYSRKQADFAAYNRAAAAAGNPRRRGIGFAAFMHGAGFTGSGERYLMSVVAVDATADGEVRVRASSTEIGQGTNTIFTQIAQDVLGLPAARISIVRPDTAEVPNSGPTVASRTTMVVGNLVAGACRELLARLRAAGLLGATYSEAEFIAACAAHHQRLGPLRVESQYQPPPAIQWDEQTYRGDAYATYAWAVYVAAVEVDLLTYETRVDDFVAVQEVGRVVHPVLAAGQIEGGVAQAIGYALYEKVVWQKGRMANGQMTNYIMPTSLDVPPIRVEFLEVPAPYGPRGAKGIGELPMDGTAPAILNAVADATGVSVHHIPMLPEDFMAAYTASAEARP
jgi:CO/xanthine dehydrogenase Mo-binding subunit